MKTGRLEAFSDGVFAIIITIMVLDLHAPKSPTIAALRPLLPSFLGYLLSFMFVGTYWNNHHHVFQLAETVNGRALWANLLLLFWLSLIPFATSWLGNTSFEAWPVFVYGMILLLCGLSYAWMIRMLTCGEPQNAPLAEAMGVDRKGWLSVLLYALATGLALPLRWAACAIYVIVAVIWLVPDRRIEKRLAQS